MLTFYPWWPIQESNLGQTVMSQPLDLRANGPYKTKETSDQLTPNLFANKSAAIIGFFSLAWHGRLGIEPTTSGFGDRLATLVHAPVYVALSQFPRRF